MGRPLWLNFVCCFDALLPRNESKDPSDPNNGDYYAIMGVERNASFEDIKRAYKRRAIELHPDKQMHKSETRRDVDFQRLKEAYDTLSNPRKREIYDAVGAETMAYLLDLSGVDAEDVLTNLMTASCLDRTKFFLLGFSICSIAIIQLVLICVNFDGRNGKSVQQQPFQQTPSPWVLILIPLWLTVFLVAFGLGYATSMLWEREKRRQKSGLPEEKKAASKGDVWNVQGLSPATTASLLLIKFVLISLTTFFLACRLDGFVQWNFAAVFVPGYFHEAIELGESVLAAYRAKQELERMITLDDLEANILGKPYSDLSQEERDEVGAKYKIVHIPAACSSSIEGGYDVSDSDAHKKARKTFFNSTKRILAVLVHIVFLGLLVPRLDKSNVNVSWWLVFLPIILAEVSECVFICYKYIPCFPRPRRRETKAVNGDINPEFPPGERSESRANARKPDEVLEDEELSGVEDLEYGGRPAENADVRMANLIQQAKSGGNAAHPHYGVHHDHMSVVSASSTIDSNDLTGQYDVNLDDPEKLVEVSFTDLEKGEDDQRDGEHFGRIDGEEEESMTWSMDVVKAVNVVLLLVITCLFVGKLEGAGYSSFWISFPFLVCFGLSLCCFGCAVYCVADFPEEDEEEGYVDATIKPGDSGSTSIMQEDVGVTSMENQSVISRNSGGSLRSAAGPIVTYALKRTLTNESAQPSRSGVSIASGTSGLNSFADID